MSKIIKVKQIYDIDQQTKRLNTSCVTCIYQWLKLARQYLNAQGLMSLYYPSSISIASIDIIFGLLHTCIKQVLSDSVRFKSWLLELYYMFVGGQVVTYLSTYENLNIMKLVHVLFMICMSICKVPENLTPFFKKGTDLHSYSTRMANLNHIPSVWLDLSHKGIWYRCETTWNLTAPKETTYKMINFENDSNKLEFWPPNNLFARAFAPATIVFGPGQDMYP